MDSNVLELQGQYAQGKLSRRDFMEKLSLIIGGAAALSLLSSIDTTPASAEVVPADDSRLQVERASPIPAKRGRFAPR